MKQQEAKRVIYNYLYHQLDDALIAEFVLAEAGGDETSSDYDLLWSAVYDIRFEMERRTTGKEATL
jgi:hypothetical protein